MAERTCALQSKAYLALREVYLNRDEALRKLKEQNKRLIWCVGSNVPDELIIAAGMVPVRAYGEHTLPRKTADKYLEPSFSSIWCGLFEKLVSGNNKELIDYVVFSSTNIMIQHLYSYYRSITVLEPKKQLPPATFFETELFNPKYKYYKRNTENLIEFKEHLEKVFYRRITEKSIYEASALCNENREALRKFAMLRNAAECRVSGTEALTVIGASLFMEKAESTKLIKQVTEDAKNWEIIDAVPIFFTGSLQETTDVYALVEEVGGNIVGEDSDWGNRHFDRDVNLSHNNIYEAITGRYMYKYANSERGLVRNRKEAVPELAKNCGAEAFLLYMNKNDESFLWDYPSQKPFFEQRGIKTHSISNQKYPLENTEQLKENISKFIAEVRSDR